jgi:hypothetical protein
MAANEPRSVTSIASDAVASPPPDLSDLAAAELDRLRHARQVLRRPGVSDEKAPAKLRASIETSAPWALIADRVRSLAPGILCLFRVQLIDARGRLEEELIVPVHAEVHVGCVAPGADTRGPTSLGSVTRALVPILRERARAAASSRLVALAPIASAWGTQTRDRETAIEGLVRHRFAPASAGLVQAGLFDQRSLRQAAARRLTWARLGRELEDWRAGRRDGADLSMAGEPEAMLLMWIAPASPPPEG